MQTDYTSCTSNHAGYKKLGCYYSKSLLSPDAVQDQAVSTNVPQWGMLGYDALSKGTSVKGKSYSTVDTAYGDCSQSPQYAKRACATPDCK
jgi:hypothetical protein